MDWDEWCVPKDKVDKCSYEQQSDQLSESRTDQLSVAGKSH
jgi:hypothetical protein